LFISVFIVLLLCFVGCCWLLLCYEGENTGVTLPKDFRKGYSVDELKAGNFGDGRGYLDEASSIGKGEGESVGCEVGSDKHFILLCCFVSISI
tara:strand:+ start:256 stop:534 length:279 start_codon:yes stop_codon:yes gene_type:complete